MTIKSTDELLAQADSTLPDNTTQLITPAVLRAMIKDFIDTMAPAYGGIQIDSLAFALTGAPTPLAPFTAVIAATPTLFTANAAAGSVTHVIASNGVAGGTDLILADGNVDGPNGDVITVEVWKNGVFAGFSTSVSCTGVGEPVGWNLTGISYTGGADATFELRVWGDPGTKTFTRVSLICQKQPVRSFV